MAGHSATRAVTDRSRRGHHDQPQRPQTPRPTPDPSAAGTVTGPSTDTPSAAAV